MTAPPYESVAPAYGVPDPRSSGLRVRLAGAAKTAPRALVVALTAFLLVNFARSHELIVQLAVLRLGKVAGVPLVILALRRLPRWQLRAAMRTGPARGMLFIGFLMVLSVPLSIWRGNSIGYLKGVGLISYIMFVTTAAMLVDTAVALTVLRATMIGVTAGAARMLLPGAPVYNGDLEAFRAVFRLHVRPERHGRAVPGQHPIRSVPRQSERISLVRLVRGRPWR
jgi:hypothetical protein